MPEDEAPRQEPSGQPQASPGEDESKQEPSDAEKLKQAIQVKTESAGLLRTKLSITIPHETIDERLEAQFDELRREAQIPGFRRGRAPRRLVEKRFGGEVKDELKDKLVAEAYLAAVEKEELKVLGEPELELEKIELPEHDDLFFTCEVELRPEFGVPTLDGIAITRPRIEVGEGHVGQQIDRMRAMRGTFEPVEAGQVQPDDLVVADVTVLVDSQVVHREENAQVYVRPCVIDGIVVESLGPALTEAKVGETRSVEVRLPESYRLEEHRGKPARMELKVHEIKRLVLPPLDESLLREMGFENEAELREWVRADLEARLDQQVRRAMRDQVYRYLLDNTSLEVPPALSQRQSDRAVARRRIDLLLQGVPEAEVDKQVDELRTTATQQVAQDLKLFFICEKIAEELGVEVSEEEINARIGQIAQRYGRRFDRVRDDLMRRGGLTALYVDLREQKCVDRLLEKASIVDAQPEPQGQGAEEKPGSPGARSRKGGRKPRRKPPDKPEGRDLSEET
jgi:trigger factor